MWEKCAIIFFAIAVRCGIGWLTQYISTLSFIYYIEKNGYIQPSDAEIKECTFEMVKQLFKRRDS